MFKYTETQPNTNRKKVLVGKLVTHAVLGLIALVLVFGSWTIVGQTEENIVKRVGNLNRNISSGPHFKIPFLESVITMDISVKKIETQASDA